MLESWLESVDTTFVVLLAATFVLFYWLLYVKSPGLPPGPFPLPVIGNLRSIPPGTLDKVLVKWRARYGDLLTFYMGNRRIVAVCGYDNIKKLLTRTGDEFLNRPFLYASDRAAKGSKGVVFSNNTQWRDTRRFTLMSMRDFGVATQSLPGKIVEEANALCQVLHESDGQVVDLKPFFSNVVSNVICSIVFGRRFDFKDPEFVDVAHALSQYFRLSGTASKLNFMPWLRFIPSADPLEQHGNAIEAFIRRNIAEHRKSFRKDQPAKDFLDLYLQQEEGGGDFDRSLFDEDHLYVIIRDLFAAGTETTATTLLWGCLFLSLNEDVQKRCREEILSVLGPDGIPELDHRRSMPLVDATILETQRIGDITPIGVLRCASRDTTFNGYRIPAKTMILPFLASVHQDREVWPDPECFRPERWLDAEKRPMLDEHLLPFSLGRRNCLGENVAKMELFLFFTMMLQKYSFSIPKGAPRPSTDGYLGVTRLPYSYSVLVTEVVH